MINPCRSSKNMTEIAFNAELLIFQFVVGDDEYGQPVIMIGEKNNRTKERIYLGAEA
ncbi:hypothetical protein KAM462_37300 [Aeromonas caviae]|nr:hypothetical protein KAM462_37300 [Aeromonas caviae]